MTHMRFSTVAAAAALVLAACGGGDAETAADGDELSGSIQLDGSSTVFPLSEAVAEEFGREQPGVRVTIGQSGTGGGFKRFCAGETAISNASREIKQEEIDLCEQNGVEYVRIPVAMDGLAVVVNPENTAVECLTVEELAKIWGPGSTVETWADVREGLPAEPIKLYGPGTNSGTFDYFTEAINHEAGASRTNYTASEDDNPLVQGVEGDRNAMAYFGYAYYAANENRLKVLGIDNGSGCVTPTPETVTSGEYAPLSRPLYLYVARSALQQPEVREFVRFYLESAPELATEVGYVPLQPAQYDEELQKIGQGD